MKDSVVLCVDDDATLLQALRALLSQQLGPGYWIEIAESGEEALEICQELTEQGRHLAVVISDYIMPGMRGDELLARVHAISPEAVKIMLTGQSDLRGVKRAINDAKLYRFIEKPFGNDDLVQTLRGAVQIYWHEQSGEADSGLRRRNQELELELGRAQAMVDQKDREIEVLARTDRLTGLQNREAMDRWLEQRCAAQGGSALCVTLVDVDHLRAINARHGLQVGDRVLVELAGLMRRQLAEDDCLGRWGEEELLLISADASLSSALERAERLRLAIAALRIDGMDALSASLGVACARPSEGADALLARCGDALAQAKAQGRNRVCAAP